MSGALRFAALVVLGWLVGLAAAAADDGRRVALVVGNGQYNEAPLKNPVNDARAVAKALREHGFDVLLRENVSKQAFESAVADFGEKLDQGATGLFYYAGHGLQLNGRNFLIPVDAQIRTENRVRIEAVDVDLVLEQMQAAKARVSLVVLDACRNNPFERRFRGFGGGLAQINAPEGTLIAYATAPGKVAADGNGANGLYTQEFLKAIKAPGLKVEDVFKQVRINVSRASDGSQVPWEASSLTGDFYFGASPASLQAQDVAMWDAVSGSNDPVVLQRYLEKFPDGNFAAVARRNIVLLQDLQAWDRVKDSVDPAALHSYIKQFPTGSFASIAQRRIAALAILNEPTPAPPSQPPALPAPSPSTVLIRPTPAEAPVASPTPVVSTSSTPAPPQTTASAPSAASRIEKPAAAPAPAPAVAAVANVSPTPGPPQTTATVSSASSRVEKPPAPPAPAPAIAAVTPATSLVAGRYEGDFRISNYRVQATFELNGTDITGSGYANKVGGGATSQGGGGNICRISGTADPTGTIQRLELRCPDVDAVFAGRLEIDPASGRYVAATTSHHPVHGWLDARWNGPEAAAAQRAAALTTFNGRYQGEFFLNPLRIAATLEISGTQISGAGFAQKVSNGVDLLGRAGPCRIGGTIDASGAIEHLTIRCADVDAVLTGKFRSDPTTGTIIGETKAQNLMQGAVDVRWQRVGT